MRFPSSKLELEGRLHLPEGEGAFPAVVVCHPHPLYGGDMSNSVVLAICYALSKTSIIAFRFNFRGVGRSQGSFGGGIGEQEDAASAITFLASRKEVTKVGLAGYSFGAKVAVSVAVMNEQVQALALISPPLTLPEWKKLQDYTKPKLFLFSSWDFFAPFREEFLKKIPEPKQYEVIPGADHLWWGDEWEVASRISAFFSRLKEPHK